MEFMKGKTKNEIIMEKAKELREQMAKMNMTGVQLQITDTEVKILNTKASSTLLRHPKNGL